MLENEAGEVSVPETVKNSLNAKYGYKVTTEQKKLIMQMAIEGYTNRDIARAIEEQFGVSLHYNTVGFHRKKWKKQINKKITDELTDAKAMEPLSVIANRLARYDEIFHLAKAEEEEAAEDLERLESQYEEKINKGEGGYDKYYYNKKQALRTKRERALQAMNEAIRNAGNDVLNKEKIQQKERELILRTGDLENQREILEETIENVAGKITTTRKIVKEQTKISGLVGWDDNEEDE